jgi:hypothetical protein
MEGDIEDENHYEYERREPGKEHKRGGSLLKSKGIFQPFLRIGSIVPY